MNIRFHFKRKKYIFSFHTTMQHYKYTFLKRILETIFALLNLGIISDSALFNELNMISPEHLKKYPYCGSMYYPPIKTTGRAVNTEPSKKLYRWVVYVERKNYSPDGVDLIQTTKCSGTVITDR